MKVSLLANGVKQGGSISLSAENDWTYTWEGLPKTDFLGNEISYEVSEESADGFVASVERVDDLPARKIWQKIPANEDFVAGEDYLLMFPSQQRPSQCPEHQLYLRFGHHGLWCHD